MGPEGIGSPTKKEARASRLALRVGQVYLVGCALGLLFINSLPPQSYGKDLQVEYLTACAWRDGVDVFTPLDELSARYFPVATTNFPHPSPHVPALVLLGLPLTVLPFPVVVQLWLAMNIGLAIMVGRRLCLSTPATLALVAWPPLWYLCLIGQFELVILALAMFAWRAAATGRDGRAGLALGLAASVKLYPLLLLLPYAVRRRIRLLAAAAAVLALSQAASLAVVGSAGLVRYYREILPSVSASYTSAGLNASPYGALLRLFGGATDVYSVFDAPALILPIAIVTTVLGLLAVAMLAPEAAPVGMFIALPSVWYWYPVLALPQIVRLLRTPSLRRAALGAAVAASFVPPLVYMLLRPLVHVTQSTGHKAPALVGMLLSIQPLGLLALLVLSVLAYRQDTRSPQFPSPRAAE